MKNRNRVAKLPRIRLISAAVASCFASHLAFANPTGPIVVNGQVTFHQQGNLLQVTNSPGSIINWQSFSIGANELTRFLQQSPSSAVLNRVVTQNPSAILGALQSNGRVFLINPNGILFGAGAQIDVAGLVASTLKLSDADFLAGRMRFTEVTGAGSVINQGAINTAQGGQVYLVGPAVTNQGIITSPKGEVILAAGNRVELVDPGTPNLRVEITAPDNQAVNLGTIVADAGRVGIHAGLINHSGTIRADSAVVTEDGRIILRATKSVALESGSVTQASGARGGEISVLAGDSVRVAGRLDASAPNGGDGGFIETSAAKVSIEPNALITTHAPYGKTGTWLIDPPDFNIASAGGDITGAQLATSLGLNSIVISSNDGAAGLNGDIFVNDAVAWSNNHSLTLSALRNVNVNRPITNTGSGAIALYAGWDGVSPAATPVVTPGVGDVNVGSALAIVPTTVSTGGTLTVTAGDSLTLQGGSANGALARLTSGGGQTISAANISLIGGTGAVDSFAEIAQTGVAGSQAITINGGGTLTLLGGPSGTNNFARIRNQGVSQQIDFPAGGAIVLTGGSGVSNDFARLRADAGTQTITGSPTITLTGGTGGLPDEGNGAQIRATVGPQNITAGETTITAGPSGFSNGVNIQSPTQVIIIDGDLTVIGGGSASGLTAGGAARIGGIGATATGGVVTAPSGPTNLTLNVSGVVTLSGGALGNAAIGSSTLGGTAPASIAMTVGGDLTLDRGLGGGARIGSASTNLFPGNIVINAGTSGAIGAGDIVINGSTGIHTLGEIAISTPGNLTLTGGTGTNRPAQILSAGSQTVSANHITLTGGSLGDSSFAEIAQTGVAGSQAITINGGGTLTLLGGPSGTNNFARIRNAGVSQQVDFPAGGAIVITGGSGVRDNFARLRADAGTQTITGSPTITLTGGTGGLADAGNNAQIRAAVGLQTITAGDTTITAGPSGFSNAANIQSPIQMIAIDGDLNMTGGGSTTGLTGDEAARIGGIGAAQAGGVVTAPPGPTNLTLNVSGDVTLTGGTLSNAAVGSATVGGTAPATIAMTVGGDLTLNTGQGAGARIGSISTNLRPGNITIIAGTSGAIGAGDIVLNGRTGINTLGAISISTPGNLTLTGGTGAGLSAQITSSGGQNITAAGVVLTGGNVGANSIADIRQTGFGADQAITVTGGGTLSMRGGLSGSDNFARIRNDGIHQQINFPVGGAIEITGGNGPNLSSDPLDSANNFARIENRSLTGMQTINTGTITLTSGLTGADNFAGIQAARQSITTSGDVTLTTRAGGGTRIGAVGATSSTDVVLNVGGKLTLNGSSETDATIGANQEGGFNTAITVTAAGDIALNPDNIPGAEVRIGSPELAVAGGNISLTSTGGNILLNDGTSIRTLGNVALNAPAPGKGITEGSDSVIQANQLTTLSAAGANLGGANQLTRFSATNTTSGPVTLSNASSLLTVNGVSQVQFGALTINQAGDLTFTGTNTSGPQSITATGDISVIPSSPTVVNAIGSQSITAGGGLIVRSSAAGSVQLSATGGQTINASYVEVTAQDAGVSVSNFGSGDQIITTSGMNAAGEGLALRNLGGAGAFATISQSVQGGTQVISVNNADRAVVDGIGGNALISDFFSGTQTVSVTGATSANALALGSPGSLGASQIGGGGIQTVTAGLPGESGSISIHGKAQGGGGNSIIVSSPVPGGTQTISTSGTLTVSGGNSPAGTQGAGIFANGINGQQRVDADGIALQGGAFGDGNNAAIGANNGTQEINAGAGGLAMVGGGIGATNSSAVITGATQIITSGGDVILLGGSNSGNGTRIGGRGGATPSPTDLALHAAGGVVLTSGSASGTAAVIGNSNVAAAQPSDISINAGGSVILNASSQSGSRIGQSEDVPGAGGDISITAGGNIQLNGTAQAARIRTEGNVDLQANQPGGMISSNGNAFVRANQLTTTSRAGTSLAGPNQVSSFRALNATSGDVTFNNTSSLLTVTGVRQVPSGPFNLNQVGDLAITGNVFSGPQSISATGDMMVGANGNPVILYAAGPQGVNSSGTPHASWHSLGVGLLDRLAGHGPINISARSLSVQGGSTPGSFAAITGGPISITTTGDLATGNLSVAGGSGLGSFAWVLSSQDIDLTVGGNLTLSTGTGLLSFARMQTVRPTSLINVHFPNLSEGGYFVNGIEGAYRNGLTGFFAGPTAARPGLRLITTYGE